MQIKFLFAALAAFLLSSCAPQTYNYSTVNTALPQLVVQADATVNAAPDLLQLRLGVVTEAEDAGQALADNNQRMETLMRMLENLGLARKELATGQFQIRPQWSVPPRPTPADPGARRTDSRTGVSSCWHLPFGRYFTTVTYSGWQ